MTPPTDTDIDTSITFDAATDTYRLHHNWQRDESVSTAVIRAVAAITNTPLTDLNSLFEILDPDALNHLYAPTAGGTSRTTGWLSFRFHGCIVRVYASGEIEITPGEDDTPITAPVPHTLRDR